MAVKLRLRRTGARNQPRYRIVAADAQSPRDGRFIEVVGHYNPTRQPHEVVVNAELARKWLKRGAQPTETVRTLLVEQGILPKSAEVPVEEARVAGVAAPEQHADAPPEPAGAKPEPEAASPDAAAGTETAGEVETPA